MIEENIITSKIDDYFKKYIDEGYTIDYNYFYVDKHNPCFGGVKYVINGWADVVLIDDILKNDGIETKVEEIINKLEF